ncbi:Gag-Pol polyprotein [Nosema granulosis]|uniref:Gag-Pol polyprotein n=1 Tax=Nosema granulosis TaxID=83296 RepID=A0A9P6H0B6_9MICR|nr:Gag-Pol polyprotein [Nosema granulosis]
MIDHYTKISEVAPLYTKDMESVISIIDNKICKRHRAPKAILTDNGKEFRNRFSEEYASKIGIEWKFGSPYNPTTTGLVERFNKTLVGKLRKITEFGKFDWARCLEKANRAYIHSYHKGNDCAPIELLEGQFITKMDEQEGLKKLLQKDFYHEKARKHIRNYRRTYDRRRSKKRGTRFEIDDHVWYKRISSTSNKLAPKWAL